MSKRPQRKKSLQIAGIAIYDQDVIAAIEATKHLAPVSRKAVLGTAHWLVEMDFFGITPRVKHVQGAIRGVSPGSSALSLDAQKRARENTSVG